MTEQIDIANKWMVGAGGGKVVILKPPRQLTPDEALVFAAWLVAVAEYQASFPFANILEQVQNT